MISCRDRILKKYDSLVVVFFKYKKIKHKKFLLASNSVVASSPRRLPLRDAQDVVDIVRHALIVVKRLPLARATALQRRG